MKLKILGTGAAFATKYNNTSFLIIDEDEYFLVDGMGGSAILRAFRENNLSWTKLHNAYLSHQHTDHLLGMIWVIRYIASLMIDGKYESNFNLFLHKELKNKVINICKEVLKPAEIELLNKKIKFVVVNDNDSLEILNMKFTFFDIHSTKAKQFGFRVDYGNHNFVFCGDEPINKLNEKYIINTDLLLLEAYCLDKDSNIYHPHEIHHNTVKESSLSAERLNVKKLLLYHTEDETTYNFRKELYTEEAKKYFSKEVLVPEDYDEIELE